MMNDMKFPAIQSCLRNLDETILFLARVATALEMVKNLCSVTVVNFTVMLSQNSPFSLFFDHLKFWSLSMIYNKVVRYYFYNISVVS